MKTREKHSEFRKFEDVAFIINDRGVIYIPIKWSK